MVRTVEQDAETLGGKVCIGDTERRYWEEGHVGW